MGNRLWWEDGLRAFVSVGTLVYATEVWDSPKWFVRLGSHEHRLAATTAKAHWAEICEQAWAVKRGLGMGVS